jgi:prevent-host-death family protein
MNVQEIGAFEAKTKLSELLEKVQRGQTFQITKRGKPVATLSPIEGDKPRGSKRIDLVDLSRRIRSAWKPGKETVKELVHGGHKY